MTLLNPYGGVPSSSKIAFKTKNHKAELIRKILDERMTKAVSGYAPLKGCCGVKDNAITRALRQLTAVQGSFIKNLPDLTLLMIEHEDRRPDVLSLVHHKAHLNIALMMVESIRLAPNEDTLTIQNGVMGSFPNFILHVRADEVDEFVADTLALKNKSVDDAAFKRWIDHYGVSRQRADFWSHFDKVQLWFDEELSSRGGILDLSKYELW